MTWRQVLQARHLQRVDAGCLRWRRSMGHVQQPMTQADGQWLTNFSSNDYLGFASRPELAEAAIKVVDQWGVGAGASHLVCGHQALHHQLEEELADFVGAQRALLFSTGYMANIALNTAFAESNDLLLHDKLNHASLIDGARLSAANFKRYAHLDLAHASKVIAGNEFQRLMLVSDSVFSMDGDEADLPALLELSEQHGALLCIDDAHGFGVLGRAGRGALDAASLAPKGNVLMMGTLSKAMGGFGAFVAGDAIFIEHLMQTARSYIYTTALPSVVVSASLRALRCLNKEHAQLSAHLNVLIQQFKSLCAVQGLPVMESRTPIQPLLVGCEKMAVDISYALQQRGFLVSAIRTPTVAKGKARLRVTITAAHTEQQITALVAALTDVWKQHQVNRLSA